MMLFSSKLNFLLGLVFDPPVYRCGPIKILRFTASRQLNLTSSFRPAVVPNRFVAASTC